MYIYLYLIYLVMPRKCCVPNCKSGYKTLDAPVSVNLFSSNEQERIKWIHAIPRTNLSVNKNSVVCRLHWPGDCTKFITHHAKERPTTPPVFPTIPMSCLRSPPPKPRPTVVASSSSRGVLPDELDAFKQLDVLNFEDIRAYSTNVKTSFHLMEITRL